MAALIYRLSRTAEGIVKPDYHQWQLTRHQSNLRREDPELAGKKNQSTQTTQKRDDHAEGRVRLADRTKSVRRDRIDGTGTLS